MRLVPKRSRRNQGLDTLLLPPCTFVSAPMELAMMQPANGNGEFIAYLASHRPLLCEFNVVSVGWCAAADETILSSHEFQMLAITLSPGLAHDNHRLSTWFVRLRSAAMIRRIFTLAEDLSYPDRMALSFMEAFPIRAHKMGNIRQDARQTGLERGPTSRRASRLGTGLRR
jgi:hypothetical protein